MYAESGISVSLVSSFVIVLILSESFAGSGFGILVGGLYHLKFPCNRVQWQEQPPERRAKRGDAAAVEKEGREMQGAATSSLTKSRFYKQYIFFKLLTKLGGLLHLQDGRMLDYSFPLFFRLGTVSRAAASPRRSFQNIKSVLQYIHIPEFLLD